MTSMRLMLESLVASQVRELVDFTFNRKVLNVKRMVDREIDKFQAYFW